MFEAIRHIYINDSMTGAIYGDGEVIGSISFLSRPDRTGVLSSIGPLSAVRECSISHYLSFRGKFRGRTSEAIEDFSPSED